MSLCKRELEPRISYVVRSCKTRHGWGRGFVCAGALYIWCNMKKLMDMLIMLDLRVGAVYKMVDKKMTTTKK